MARVVVGLSGGVDSSVAAYLLKEQGHEVIGVFMKNWHDESVTISNECPWLEDSNDALLVAEKLGIPFQTVDLSQQYQKKIVDYMFSEYEAGRTPNPDVLCNREIKYDVFLEIAKKLHADFMATGHYCQKEETKDKSGNKVYRLLAGADNNKDQSYFLCQLNQSQLSMALFPIGHLEKPEVRRIAEKADLITANKKDSQGLCFIGKVKLPDFLQQQLKPKQGDILEIPASVSLPQATTLKEKCSPYDLASLESKKLATHKGAHYYTVGQRRGLGIGGTALPAFVLGTDTQKNIIYVGQGDEHPALWREGLFISTDEFHWVRPDLEIQTDHELTCMGRVRYRQDLVELTIHKKVDGYYITFATPERGVTPGQFAAFYVKNELIASGTIA